MTGDAREIFKPEVFFLNCAMMSSAGLNSSKKWQHLPFIRNPLFKLFFFEEIVSIAHSSAVKVKFHACLIVGVISVTRLWRTAGLSICFFLIHTSLDSFRLCVVLVHVEVCRHTLTESCGICGSLNGHMCTAHSLYDPQTPAICHGLITLRFASCLEHFSSVERLNNC